MVMEDTLRHVEQLIMWNKASHDGEIMSIRVDTVERLVKHIRALESTAQGRDGSE